MQLRPLAVVRSSRSERYVDAQPGQLVDAAYPCKGKLTRIAEVASALGTMETLPP